MQTTGCDKKMACEKKRPDRWRYPGTCLCPSPHRCHTTDGVTRAAQPVNKQTGLSQEIMLENLVIVQIEMPIYKTTVQQIIEMKSTGGPATRFCLAPFVFNCHGKHAPLKLVQCTRGQERHVRQMSAPARASSLRSTTPSPPALPAPLHCYSLHPLYSPVS